MNDIDQTALEIARAFIPVDVVGQQRANLQVAIIEAIKKHANPKTLADVQPGGRVRLWDAPWPEIDAILADAYSAGATGLPFEGIARRHAVRAAVAALSAQPSPDRSFDLEAMLAVCVPGGDIADPQVIADNIRHWFAAQPSPGGQGDDSPMAKMAAALRGKAEAERAAFDQRVQSGEWGPMPDNPDVLELPPLPEEVDSVRCMIRGEEGFAEPCDYYFTSKQMRDYARTALAASQPVEFDDKELQFYREHIGNDLDNMLIDAGVFEVTHEGGYKACWANSMDALERLIDRQPVGEPVTVEAVATVRRNGDGDRYIDWLTEGGIADLEVGNVLMVSDRAITDEDGSGEIYAAPPAQAVDLGQLQRFAPHPENRAFGWMEGMREEASGDWLHIDDVRALIDSQAGGK